MAESYASCPRLTLVDSANVPGDAVSEDRVGHVEDSVWAIDGATPLRAERHFPEAATDAVWLVGAVDSLLRRELQAGSREPLSAIVAKVIIAVSSSLRAAGVDATDVTPSCSLALVRSRGSRLEYLILGDVELFVSTGDGVRHVRDDRINAVEQESVSALRHALAQGGSYADARRQIHGVLEGHRRELMNRADGYWTLSDDPAAAAHAVAGELTASHGSRVLLGTDGFLRLIEPFRLTSPRALLRDCDEGRLTGLIEELRAAERSDPDCRLHPRIKPSDDAAALVAEAAS